jgi:Carboxypeptidase regulatory-like domain
MRKMIRTLALGFLTAGWLLQTTAPYSLAQAQSRKEKREEALKRALEGLVTDPADSVLTGAVVKLKDLKTLEVRSYITKDDGMYHFFGLNINSDYEVQASFSGMASKPRTLSVFDSRKKPNLDLKLEPKMETKK